MKEIMLSVIYTKEKNWIVTWYIEIDVVSQGKTMKSAQRNIREAITLYLKSFGEPDLPEHKFKPVVKPISVPNYAKLPQVSGGELMAFLQRQGFEKLLQKESNVSLRALLIRIQRMPLASGLWCCYVDCQRYKNGVNSKGWIRKGSSE